VFNSAQNLKKSTITDGQMATWMALLVGIDLVVLILYQTISPRVVTTTFVDVPDAGPVRHDKCIGESEDAFLMLLLAYKMVLLLWGGVVSWKSRKLDSVIGKCVYYAAGLVCHAYGVICLSPRCHWE